MIFFLEYICLTIIGIGLYYLIEQLPGNDKEENRKVTRKVWQVTGGLSLVAVSCSLLIYLLHMN